MDTLFTLRQDIRQALSECKRRRKYQPSGNYTPVEETALTALFEAERTLSRMIDKQRGESHVLSP
uniref:Uncharacterized protein n=1 Tax=viral metagenome TaxID=1070528 RepID=A0A6M3L9N0_9ZZZZ